MSPSRPTGLAEARIERLPVKKSLYGSLGASERETTFPRRSA
ncbi:hypothetical protein [Streptomyces sp. NPDC019890]